MNGFFVCIIQSEKDGSFYRGFTEDPVLRLIRHNRGESNNMRNKMPWRLVYVAEFLTKTAALQREKGLKKYSHQQIEILVKSAKNIVGRFSQVKSVLPSANPSGTDTGPVRSACLPAPL
ncbi:GIY-YIG nuclease family protein [Flaviaesturariibacter flavus]|uniref:GIY-YIG nuclease family protein n=1 Tax=Flaviaesturariibacter flavus TaxID=2502780 RepID=A0A4R1BJM7_9BACT|nr:GIY-YIG nuclease family protein [Flaviaesturariibacter flavus]TCJ17408.1 GIY-YIG nuclease family protein [Flaviaesturariibacter flavus]